MVKDHTFALFKFLDPSLWLNILASPPVSSIIHGQTTFASPSAPPPDSPPDSSPASPLLLHLLLLLQVSPMLEIVENVLEVSPLPSQEQEVSWDCTLKLKESRQETRYLQF